MQHVSRRVRKEIGKAPWRHALGVEQAPSDTLELERRSIFRIVDGRNALTLGVLLNCMGRSPEFFLGINGDAMVRQRYAHWLGRNWNVGQVRDDRVAWAAGMVAAVGNRPGAPPPKPLRWTSTRRLRPKLRRRQARAVRTDAPTETRRPVALARFPSAVGVALRNERPYLKRPLLPARGRQHAGSHNQRDQKPKH